MTDLASQYRRERRLIEKTRQRIHENRWLRCHVFLIALCTLSCLALGGALLRSIGIESLAWRYALLLPLTYLVYLGLLRLWAAYLVSREQIGTDGLDLATELPMPRRSSGAEAEFHSGGGGDFGGGGASGDFGEGASELGGKALQTGGELLGALDDGAVVALPLLAVIAMASLLLGVALGAAIDHWLPDARSLPHALNLLSKD
jgi:hypothetical protein